MQKASRSVKTVKLSAVYYFCSAYSLKAEIFVFVCRYQLSKRIFLILWVVYTAVKILLIPSNAQPIP